MNEAIISHDGPGHRWLAQQSSRGVKWQLDRVYALLARLGDPQKAFASIAIAGTNGKGSVSSMLAGMLHEGGANVGHFTSPHFVETRERVRIGARCVTPEQLDEALVAVAQACDWQTDRPNRIEGDAPLTDEIKATPFEALTAAALWLFRRENVDVAVLECGLGGRLDATNCADPIISVITHISRDHTKSLGETVAEIAREKVAIGRDGRPMIVAQPEIVVSAARAVGISPRLLRLGDGLRVEQGRVAAGRMTTEGVLVGSLIGEPLHIEVALAGLHQLENAGLAVMAYCEAVPLLAARDVRLAPPVDVVHALGAVHWPGRAEVIADSPLTVLDAAHNESGAAALSELLRERGDRWHIVLSMRNNREPEDVIRALAPIAHTFWMPRMRSPAMHLAADLGRVADAVAPRAAVVVASAEKCLQHARLEAFAGVGVAVTGSIYGIGELLQRGLITSPRLARWLSG